MASWLKSTFYTLPTDQQRQIRSLIKRLAPWRKPTADLYILSYPKCGQTWLSVLLAKSFALHYGIQDNDLLSLKLHHLHQSYPGVPRLRLTHDDDPYLKKKHELITNKSFYQDKKVIFLVRDPRDVMISYFFTLQKKRLKPEEIKKVNFNGASISEFLRHEIGSLETMLHFYNIWADQQHIPQEFLLLCYEDLIADPHGQLVQVLAFLGLTSIAPQIIEEAVAYGSFENMRRLERQGFFTTHVMQPKNKEDLDSYKTRRGKVGGYLDYLSPEDLAYVNERIASQLADFYPYGVLSSSDS